MSYVVIDDVVARSSWPWRELRRVARVRRVPNENSDRDLLSLSANTGIQARPEDGGRQLASGETISNYWTVEPNDLIFNPMWAIEGGVAVSGLRGAVSTAYRVYEFDSEVHPWFAHHYFRSSVAIAQYRLLVRGVTTFDRSVTREDFEAMPMPVPSLAEQRAIADYLDAETARIDALIAKKQRLLYLLEERFLAQIDDECSGDDVALRRVIARFVDYRGATPEKTDRGVPLLTATHIKGGAVDHTLEPVFVSESTYVSWMRRGFPTRGDVLLTMEAPLGEVAQITETRVALAQRLMLLKTDANRCAPDYLAFALRSRAMQDQLRAYATGSTALGIKADRLKGLPVPVPSPTRQAEIVAALRHEERVKMQVARLLSHQLNLLTEHRQALITAAVTGEFQVPGAA